MEIQPAGRQYSWRNPEPGEEDLPFIDQLVLEEALFFQLWVELPDEARVRAFRSSSGCLRGGAEEARPLPP